MLWEKEYLSYISFQNTLQISWHQVAKSCLFSLAFLHPTGRIGKSLAFRALLLFSHSVMSDSLWPHGLQNARLPCPSRSPGVCWNSCSLSRWCHPAVSSSVASFSSCPQSFPASGSFPTSWFLHQVAQVLELQLQHQSFQWIFRVDFLYDHTWGPSLCFSMKNNTHNEMNTVQ